jgi:EpsI family protein
MLVAAPFTLVAGSRDVEPRQELHTLPGTVGNWWMQHGDTSRALPLPGISEALVGAYPTATGFRKFVGADDEVWRVYRNPSAMRLRLYVGYYRRQEEGRELTGDAGRVLAAASTPVRLTVGSETMTVGEIVREADGVQRGILYWYDINGRVVSSAFLAKAYTIWDGFTRRRTNGAVVMISWDGPEQDGREQAAAFARELLSMLRRHFES